MKYIFKHINPLPQDWDRIESAVDSTVFHCRQWADYLTRIGYTPFIATVYADTELIGYFVGERIWRGVTMITAPFEGIGTYTQGLAMFNPISLQERVDIYKQFAQWVIKTGIANYIQVDDWQLREDRPDWVPTDTWRSALLDENQLKYDVRPTLHLPINKTEEELWSGLQYKSCKYSVNKARKLGLCIRTIENQGGVQPFVEKHYDQLYEVCTRKGVTPKTAQAKKRMIAVCEALLPNRVLMIEVVGKDEQGAEQVMSSGIFCYDKGESIYWTGASYARYQKYCPNELMVWEAIKILRERGAGDLNFGGMAHYKLKFGTIYAYVPRMIFTKYQWVYDAKLLARKVYYNTRQMLGKIRGLGK